MKAGRLLVENFDARIPRIEIKPKGPNSKVVIHAKMYDENDEKKVNVKIHFDDVAAVEFCINFFDNSIGAEAFGLYEIEDVDFMDSVVKRNFERRKEVYLLEGDYAYDLNEPADMLNVFDLSETYQREKEKYHAFVQNVDAGVYIIIAKEFQVVR